MFKKRQPAQIKKSHIILLGLVVVATIILRLWQFHYDTMTVELRGQQLNVQVAKTPKQWYKGLGKRDDLGKYDGMLFIFPFFDKYTMVMRDMRFPIDIVWFAGGEVVDIAPNVPVEPQDKPYIPRQEANVVLELPAGWVDQYGLKIGDKLQVVRD